MMQTTMNRIIPRAVLSARPLVVAPARLYSNQLQRHEGRRGEVGNRRDWNDDLYDNFFNGWINRFDPFDQMMSKDFDRSSISQWRPRSSITETKDGNILITAEMPGLGKEDIHVDLSNNVLTIKGSKKEEKTDEGNKTYSKQRRSFFRSFTLPEDVDAAGIKAKMENGILEVTVPKPKEVEQKNTNISIE